MATLQRLVFLAILLAGTAACSDVGSLDPDTPAARYQRAGPAAITGAYDFGLF